MGLVREEQGDAWIFEIDVAIDVDLSVELPPDVSGKVGSEEEGD